MEYARVGTSGLYVSKVILGTAGYGSSKWQDWVIEEDDALPLLEHAFRMGINTWDTADAYSNGRSEEIIGKALKKYDIPREQVVILSKVYYAIDPAKQPSISESLDKTKQHLVNRVGLSRKHILSAVAESVRRLGTYIDVLQIHRLDRDVCPVEIMNRWDDRGSKREQTDKLLKGLVRGQENNPTDEEIVNRVAEIAEKREVPMATIALSWCLKKGVYPITGLGNKERTDQAVEAVRFRLTDEEIAYLEEPYQPKRVSY